MHITVLNYLLLCIVRSVLFLSCIVVDTASCEPIGASDGATVDEHLQLAAVITTG